MSSALPRISPLDSSVHIPRVYWATTTARILTLERIRGIKISDVDALEADGLDRREIAAHATRILLTMILEYGFFHADPHPGNISVEAGGRIALIDFGMTGDLDSAMQDVLLRLLLAISRQDAGRLADVALELGRTRVHVDRNGLRRDMQRMLDRYCDRSLGDVKLTAMLTELLTILRWHHLRLSPDLALLVKALGMSEGLGVRLDSSLQSHGCLYPVHRRTPAASVLSATVGWPGDADWHRCARNGNGASAATTTCAR